MNRYKHLKEKAIRLRRSKRSLVEIVQMLGLPKTTVYGWVKEIPLGRKRTVSMVGTKAMQAKYKALRDEAYNQAADKADELLHELRDFVVVYMCEGYRKTQNTVAVCNSNAMMMVMCNNIIKKFASNKITYSVQYHVDQNTDTLANYWSKVLGIKHNEIRFVKKTNSGQMKGRNWRCINGVMTISVGDTYLKSKIDALSDHIMKQWNTERNR